MATILIVDDNKNNLQVLGNILNENKYKVALAINGKTALRLAEKAKPDLIVLDIMMPEMDGFEVCQRLKTNEKTNEIPIIFLTAKTDLEDVVRGFQLGGVDYITKPFKKEELLVRVRNHINLVESKKVIERQAEELKAANSLKDKLFSVVASDIKRGMNYFIEVPKLLMDERIDYSIEDYISIFNNLKEKAEQTEELLENILWWSRSQRKLLNPKMTKINLQDLINEVISKFELTLSEKNIHIDNNISPNDIILGDLQFYNIIFKNIIQNAIKFSHKNGKIHITSNNEDNLLKVNIEDHGIGMDEEIRSKVLDRYSYYTQFGTNAEKGNGLGLKLVYELLEIMDTTIEIESTPDQGTIVSLNFPI